MRLSTFRCTFIVAADAQQRLLAVAALAARNVASYWKRIGLAALLGVFGLFAISSIYWNWYGFPDVFFVAQGVDMIVGWALGGAVIAKLIPTARTDFATEPVNE